MKRKVIQLAIMPPTENTNHCLFALCNDGKVLVNIPVDGGTAWKSLPDIPQPEQKKAKRHA